MAGWTDGTTADMHAEMSSLTLRIAGQALLGTDLSAQAPLVRAGLEAALAEFGAADGVMGDGTGGLPMTLHTAPA
jgi:hypothetical protein